MVEFTESMGPAVNTEEDPDTGRFRILCEKLDEALAGNQSLYQEMVGMRRDLAALKEYVEGLEEKAQAMASPEAMQKMMTDFMGGLG